MRRDYLILMLELLPVLFLCGWLVWCALFSEGIW